MLAAIAAEDPEPDHRSEVKALEAALCNLRKQHLWGAVDDDRFKAEFRTLERQRRALEPRDFPDSTPNLDRAAALLQDLPALWQHPGVTQEQRRELAREVFEEVRLREGRLVGVQPRKQYAPLFAYSLWKQHKVAGGDRSD